MVGTRSAVVKKGLERDGLKTNQEKEHPGTKVGERGDSQKW